MTRLLALIAVLSLSVLVAPSVAQKGKQDVTLTSSANPATFSTPITLKGRVKGAQAGVVVVLQRRSPTGTTFRDGATATTNDKGEYSFTVRPRRNTVYRAMARTATPVQSAELLQNIAPLVGFIVSDSTPTMGQRVVMRGTVRPPHDGKVVHLQRKNADGSWANIRTMRLRDAGRVYSRYRRAMRARATATYRVHFPGDADHVEAYSRERTLTVG